MRVVRVEEEGVGGLVSLQVQDPECFALPDDVHPIVTGWNDTPIGSGFRRKKAFSDHGVRPAQ
jgi:hypothetical protein